MENYEASTLEMALNEYMKGESSLKQISRKYGIKKQVLYQHYQNMKNNKTFTKDLKENTIEEDITKENTIEEINADKTVDNEIETHKENEDKMGKQKYTNEFIAQVLKELEEGICNVPEASEIYDIPKSTIYRWKDVYSKPQKGNEKMLEKENDIIINEADILENNYIKPEDSKSLQKQIDDLKEELVKSEIASKQYMQANQLLQQTIAEKEQLIESLKLEKQTLTTEKQRLVHENSEDLEILRTENKNLKSHIEAISKAQQAHHSEIINQYKADLEAIKRVLKMSLQGEL